MSHLRVDCPCVNHVYNRLFSNLMKDFISIVVYCFQLSALLIPFVLIYLLLP